MIVEAYKKIKLKLNTLNYQATKFLSQYLAQKTLCLLAVDAYCTVEVDSFSHFFIKAKTRVSANGLEPVWNEVCTLRQGVLCLEPVRSEVCT